MPTLYDIKPQFQALLRPLVARLAAAGVSANQITVGAMILSLAGGALCLVAPGNRPVLGVIAALLAIRMGLNAIDGMLAREHDQKSRAGLIYNEVGDVVSDAGLYLPLAVALEPFEVSIWVIVVFAFAAFLTEFTGVLGPHLGATRRYDGPMGKSDRAIGIAALLILLASGMPGGAWVSAVIAVMTVLALWTTVRRAKAILDGGTL
ncbi:MAG: CDP-alcohol phosphatidyltransferase family protein [Hyphomicrobiales bacterium]|nr:CDP-alcohol phosphatidyltransferase family protein [Hyphomicrobiales bacterium]